MGILYPVTLLPYPIEYYNDEVTKKFLISLFAGSFALIFGYLAVSVYNITHTKNKS